MKTFSPVSGPFDDTNRRQIDTVFVREYFQYRYRLLRGYREPVCACLKQTFCVCNVIIMKIIVNAEKSKPDTLVHPYVIFYNEYCVRPG